MGYDSMRKILFLDFDGVLHPDGVGVFSNLSIFERCIFNMPDVEIVISSTWREDETLDGLKRYFSEFVQERIIGVTPVLDDGCDYGGRQREILSYLSSEGVNSENSCWIAVDDMKMFFDENCPNLIWIDGTKGFSDEDGILLLEWYKKSGKC